MGCIPVGLHVFASEAYLEPKLSNITNDKPKLHDYPKWVAGLVNRTEDTLRGHYAASTTLSREFVVKSKLWQDLIQELSEANDAYRSKYKSPLIVPKAPELYIKPFESILNKTFRKNVVNNDNWPLEPAGGWMVPPDWIFGLNDVFRTTLVVSYVDGIQFLSERLTSVIVNNGATVTFDLNSSMVGYYAGHLIIDYEVDVLNFDFSIEKRRIKIEIQITTHVKEAVKTILHPIYEKARVAETANDRWQWDFNCDEFVANNLGHIIHYVEGMIVRVREESERKIS